MDRERWAEIKRVANACLELDAGRPESHIAELCGPNAELMAEVLSLLQSHAEMGEFLVDPALPVRDELLTGREVGRYRLCEPIGDGGMGTVYRGVRSADFEKQVAIKLVKRGMDTDFILRRFLHERQILAALDHPNIARLLDGGTTEEGRPYLVMEYIEGKPITEYSDEHALRVPERLQLFRTVCLAVQYAHQHLVVHRDLKPGNILVTSGGVPILLDFGIAKLLQPEAEATITSVRLMTPECASPEQVLGQPITTASDIYTLGVLLYQLLTGERPYHFTTGAPEEVARVVCETEPKRPGSVRPLADDLDKIVLKAMHKEPARRYVSAEQLAEDIRRYLEGLPVNARKDTFGYRARKFVGRHRVATAAALGVALSLTAGMVATLWEAHVARMERARAERRFNDVRELANSLIFELHDGIKDLPGSTPVRKLIVDRALHYLDRLEAESGGDPGLQREIAGAYERLGLVQGQYGAANLGDSAGALQSLQKALSVRKSIAGRNRADSTNLREMAGSYRMVATQLLANGSLNGALAAIQAAIRISEDLMRHRPGDAETLSELAADYDTSGVIQGESPGSLGDLDGGVLNFRKAVATNQALLRINPLNEDTKRAIERNYVHLGTALGSRANFQEGLTSEQKALELAKELANGTTSATRMRDVAVAYNHIAASYEGLGDLKQTLASFAEGRKIYLALAATDPRNATVQSGLAIADLNVGGLLVKTGHARQGLALMDDGVGIKERLIAEDLANLTERSRLAQFYQERSEARERSGMAAGALSDAQKALTSWQMFAAQDVQNASAQLQVARYQFSVARLSAKMGFGDRAEAGFQSVLRLCGEDVLRSRSELGVRKVAAEAYSGLGNIASARGSNSALPVAQRLNEWIAARSFYQQSLVLRRPPMGKPGANTLSSSDSVDPKPLVKQIAQCDRQMKRLKAIRSPNGRRRPGPRRDGAR